MMSRFMHIKLPLSAYNFFCASTEVRETIRAEEPDLPPSQMLKRLGSLWRRLTEEDRATYVDMATRDKERYNREREAAQERSSHKGRTDLCEQIIQNQAKELRMIQAKFTKCKEDLRRVKAISLQRLHDIWDCTEKTFHLEMKIIDLQNTMDSRDFLESKMIEHIRTCTSPSCSIPGCSSQRSELANGQQRSELASGQQQAVEKGTPSESALGFTCCICMDAQAVVAFLHGESAHLCVCQRCQATYNKSTCPMCKHKNCRLVKVY